MIGPKCFCYFFVATKQSVLNILQTIFTKVYIITLNMYSLF